MLKMMNFDFDFKYVLLSLIADQSAVLSSGT